MSRPVYEFECQKCPANADTYYKGDALCAGCVEQKLDQKIYAWLADSGCAECYDSFDVVSSFGEELIAVTINTVLNGVEVKALQIPIEILNKY